MIDIYFEKLYRYPRIQEPVSVAIPLKKGELYKEDSVAVIQEEKAVPTQAKVTSRYEDGSIRYLFVRFLADLPANKGLKLECDLSCSELSDYAGVVVEETDTGYFVNCDGLCFAVEHNSKQLFAMVDDNGRIYDGNQFEGPYLTEAGGKHYEVEFGKWKVIEAGPVCAVLSVTGKNIYKGKEISFETRITAYAGKPWFEVGYRLINTSNDELDIESLVFHFKAGEAPVADTLGAAFDSAGTDSTGCGDSPTDNSMNDGPVFHTRGITELSMLEKKAPVENVRTLVGISNYKTDFLIGKDGEAVYKYIDSQHLLKEANEHYAEVLYGTFLADRTDSRGGLCMTVYQAQQNFPKAVRADNSGISVMLVPQDMGKVVMQSGMAREQQFLMHFHKPEEAILELDNRSLIYQMPDRPCISPSVFKESGVMLDVFPEKLNDDVEIALMAKADSHSRCYGMLNWGDGWDSGYTTQGRGNGKIVYTNNEYDYPHSCALQYARTGVRRYLDYMLVSAKHWLDVDICHYSSNPLYIGGQWEHTAGHCKNGIMVCSHEWVEGLLDLYHFSGDERALEAALGIGDNVLRLLDTPMYAHAGEANARETGWALRSLTALYVETNDKKWLAKSEWIIDSFKAWENQYGSWLAPYTDNTVIRVGFMISVAVGSVMRYYRVFKRDDIKDMILRAVDDLIENCLMDNNIFYYKELPSLARVGNNTLLLESLAIAYELTGDTKYLLPGIKTFERAIRETNASVGGAKRQEDDTVITAGSSTKNFAQSFIPLITYYKALSENEQAAACERGYNL